MTIHFAQEFFLFSSYVFVICNNFTFKTLYISFLGKYKNIKTLNIYKNILCCTVQPEIVVKICM